MDETTRKNRLKKLIDLLKSWKGTTPDYDNLDFSRYHQTEEEYQEEQRRWMAGRSKKCENKN